MSKSRFDGGTLGNGRWDEEEHPRGRDGRFASGGGGGMSKAAQARKKLFAKIKRKIEHGEPVTDYEREIAIKHILPKEERDDFVDKEEYGDPREGYTTQSTARMRREAADVMRKAGVEPMKNSGNSNHHSGFSRRDGRMWQNIYKGDPDVAAKALRKAGFRSVISRDYQVRFKPKARF